MLQQSQVGRRRLRFAQMWRRQRMIRIAPFRRPTRFALAAAGIGVLLRAVDALRSGLAIKSCFVILHRQPADECKITILIEPVHFLKLMPPTYAARRAWLTGWASHDDPVQLATGEDFR